MIPRRLLTHLALCMLLATDVVAGQGPGEAVIATECAGVMVYRVPFGSQIRPRELELFPHRSPLRAAAGWRYTYVDFGYLLTSIALVEEIPPVSNQIIGHVPLGESAYLALAGKGYTEIRATPGGAGKKITWQEGDVFVTPYGHWVGHANPSPEPARLMRIAVVLSNDFLRQDLPMEEGRPRQPFLLQVLGDESADSDGGRFQVGDIPPPVGAVSETYEAGALVYDTPWGTPINVRTVRTDVSYHKTRAASGWKSAHIQPGGRILDWFVIQDIPAQSDEIGHRHGEDALFWILEGTGQTSFRDKADSAPTIVRWTGGDMFALPVRPDGVYHSHANTSNADARLFATSNKLKGKDLLNPFDGRTHREYGRRRRDSDRVFE